MSPLSNQLEGYASYEGLEGGTIIGQYYRGALLFGITMTREIINVGTKDYYASYSSTTGELLGVTKDGEGEIWNGKRHGYGVYYFHDGGFWYGPFHNNGQTGYGALFTSQGKMRVGKWDGIR